jgi:hypothetical protein
MRKGDRVENVVGFGFRPRPILIDQHDSPPHPAHHQRVCRRRANKAAAYDTCFHIASCFDICKCHSERWK